MLEQGTTPLLKTLFQFHQDCLNNIRKNLQEKKGIREKFNKDTAVLYTIYPSEKRYAFLGKTHNDIKYESQDILKAYSKVQSEFYQKKSQKSQFDSARSEYSNQKRQIETKGTCPTCRNGLSTEMKAQLCEGLDKKIVDAQTQASSLISAINNLMIEMSGLDVAKKDFESRLEKISRLRFKLETRIQQKQFIYTAKDVEVLKRAIDALDRFSVEYVVKWIQGLEPIVNDIIKIIDFRVKFEVDKKGNIDIQLTHKGQVYDYEDLSSGQKLLLTAGFQLAILLEKGEEGLIIADEGFSSLSEVNLDKLIAMLKQYPLQLIYIIHRVNSVPEGVKEIKL